MSATTTTKKIMATLPLPTPVFEALDDVEAIAAAFQRDGLVVLRLLSAPECAAAIKEQVTEVLLQQPWQRALVVRDPATGAPLDIERDTDAYLRVLTAPRQPPAVLKAWEDAWPFHAGFGACCDPTAFHLETVWAARQDPRLYAVARRLLGAEDLWVDVNRVIHKLPGKGEDEFL